MTLGILIRKEFGRIKSDKRTLLLLFAIPSILIVIFGLTTGGGPSEFFNIAVISKDKIPTYENYPLGNSSEYDKTLIKIFEENSSAFGLYESYRVKSKNDYKDAYDECIGYLKSEVIDVFIVLTEEFSESIDNSTDTLLIYYIDGSDLMAVNSIELALQEPLALFRMEIDKMVNFSIMIPYLEFEVPFWESQMLNYALPIILPMIILGTTMNLTSLSIVSEGPLPRMLITPATKRQVIISKLIANCIIMLLQAVEIFTLVALFGLYSLGSLFDLFLVMIVLGLCGVSIGLFISAIAKTDQVANQLYIMSFIIIIMFSGSFINIESLPLAMQLIVLALPLGHAVPILVDITLKGLPIDPLSFLSLLLISIVVIILTYITYSFKKLEV